MTIKCYRESVRQPGTCKWWVTWPDLLGHKLPSGEIIEAALCISPDNPERHPCPTAGKPPVQQNSEALNGYAEPLQ